MNLTNQMEDKSLLVQTVEQTRLSEIREENQNEKRKKIPADLGQSVSALLSQLPPETQELIRKFSLLSVQANAAQTAEQTPSGKNLSADTSGSVANASTARVAKDLASQQATEKSIGHASAIDQSNADKSPKDKTRAELDAMMLAVVHASVMPQQTNAIDPAQSKHEENVKLHAAARTKNGVESSDDVHGESDNQKQTVKHVNGQQHLAAASPEKNISNVVAQPMVNAQQSLPTTSARSTQEQNTIRLNTVAQSAPQINHGAQKTEQLSAADLSKLDARLEQANTDQKTNAPDDDQSPAEDLRDKLKKEEMPTTVQFQHMAPVPSAQDVAVAQFQQLPTPSTPKQTTEQDKILLAGQDRTGASEGIRYNLDSWGQNQSVQIVGSNKTGYTLRPSDAQVQSVLEKHKDDSLKISIASAPGQFGQHDDIDALSIKAASGNESS